MGKSKTNVAARQASKSRARLCRYCGQPVTVTMTFVGGRKKMLRNCCGKITNARP
ncbi:MAG: hypothetical protein KBA64_10470 [Armatimonadetes bacterium]|jgi:hypothetical protein|nr:hypothetical protein [Armatimonadota bacterium]MDI9602092.1 hypothetical protein [Acidobacteriota bacterium]NLN91323.1 hypothetical protein [candidate division WS1 bacterium]